MNDVPPEARPVARVLLAGPDQSLLLLHAEDPVGGKRWWVTPGGGLESGETFEEAARRELREETGLNLPIGRWVWTRRHVYSFNGQWCDQYERFFLATTDRLDIRPDADGLVRHRVPVVESRRTRDHAGGVRAATAGGTLAGARARRVPGPADRLRELSGCA